MSVGGQEFKDACKEWAVQGMGDAALGQDKRAARLGHAHAEHRDARDEGRRA